MYLKEIKLQNLILKSNIFLAPLAGYTNLPTRLLYRRQGVAIAYSEMVSADGLHYNFNKSAGLLRSDPVDRPLGIQIFGSNANMILSAYKSIEKLEFDVVDINCGCSVKKVIKNECGAYLLKKPDEIFKIVNNIKNITDKPVSIKIRSGWDRNSINYLEVYDAAIHAKVDLITLHPRTKSDLFSGKADRSHIKKLKSISSIPVIGNGDIFSGEDAIKMMDETGCDGVMLARGVIQNPFLIEECIAAFKGDTYIPRTKNYKIDTAKEHLNELIKYSGEKFGVIEFRKICPGYIRGFENASSIRSKINLENSSKEVFKLLDQV